MAFGVDTTNNLDTEIDWSEFHAWKAQYPEFAGRYFQGGYEPGASEFTGAKSQTNNALSYIFPLRGNQSSQETTGSAGYTAGQDAANGTCGLIDSFRASGQLALPSSGERVYVYADWEAQAASISVDWWVGWANTIYNFGSGEIYAPALYCPFAADASGLYVPYTDVQDMLNAVHAAYPTDSVRCYGFSAPSPFFSDYCTAAGTSDWSVFGTYSMPVRGSEGTTAEVPVLIHQYAEPTGCADFGYTDYAGGQNLDMDGTDSTGAEGHMMVIQ